MADLSFLPDDFDQSSSLLHRLRRQASHLLLRSPPKPPPSSRRRPATPTRTPVDDRSFVPYIPLANRYERSVPPVRTRSRAASVSSTSSTERSFPTTPLNNVFPITPACATDESDDHQLDLHIIRHSLSLPWLIAKERPDENGGVPLPECDPSDAIPDSPTLPPSLALPMPAPVLVLAPVVAASESVPIAASRPAPTLTIPPAPSYPPPVPSIADSDSGWDDETMVDDSETAAEFELDSASDPSPSRNHTRSDMATLDWTLHLSRSHPRPSRSKLVPSSLSRPVSPSVTDWTLELPAPVPVVPAAAAAPQPQGHPAPLPSPVVQSRVSQCPSSWLSPFPHTSTPPPPLRKAKSAHSLLPLRPVPSYLHGSFLLSP